MPKFKCGCRGHASYNVCPEHGQAKVDESDDWRRCRHCGLLPVCACDRPGPEYRINTSEEGLK